MCTVTFVPWNDGTYFLTSNRDEYTSRPSATPPKKEKYNQYELIYPRDPKGGGTWIAADNRGSIVCLLNGAFKPHVPRYPYRHSRGLVVLDYFKFDNFNDFFEFYLLDNIEPFTLVIISSNEAIEFKWDGNQKTFRKLPKDQPHIWSSVTLYEDKIIKLRENWFKSWLLDNEHPGIKEIIDFHKFSGDGNSQNDVLMEREGGLKTISITSIMYNNSGPAIYYEDLVNKKIFDHPFSVSE